MNKQSRIKAFEETRIVLYAATLISGVLQFILPFHSLCEKEKYSCPFCGIRTAIVFLIKLDIKNAYESNHGIVILVIIAILMIIDTALIVYKRIKRKNLSIVRK